MKNPSRRLEQLLLVANTKAKEGPPAKNKCWECKNKKSVPGNAHIECVKPDANMTGSPHGIKNGWFMYPMLYDPVWMTTKCKNFEKQVNRVRKSDSKSK